MQCNGKRGGSVASAKHQPRPPLHMECGSKRKVGGTSQRQREGQAPLRNTDTQSYATGLNNMACDDNTYVALPHEHKHDMRPDTTFSLLQ
jgi:hypothetical protein